MKTEQLIAARQCVELLRVAANTAPEKQAGLWTVGLALTTDPYTGDQLPEAHPTTGEYAHNLMTLIFRSPTGPAEVETRLQHMRLIAVAGGAYAAILVAPVLTVQPAEPDAPLDRVIAAVQRGEAQRAIALRLEAGDLREMSYRFFRIDQGHHDFDPGWTDPVTFSRHSGARESALLVDRSFLGNPPAEVLHRTASAILTMYAARGWVLCATDDGMVPIVCIEGGS